MTSQDSVLSALTGMKWRQVFANGLNVKIDSTMGKDFAWMSVFNVTPTIKSMAIASPVKILRSMFSAMKDNACKDSARLPVNQWQKKTHVLPDST